MTNPLDYTIQDHDAMRYALMQDSSYRGGGAVHMEDGGLLNSVYRKVVPAHLRTFGETLMGDRTPITEKNFTPSELDQMRNAIMSSRKDREAMNQRMFANTIDKEFKSGASDKELMAIMKQGPSQKIDQSVGYQHYPGGDVEVRRDTDFGHDASIRSTLGRFAYNKDANGNLIATDNYKFTNDLPDQTRPTSDYAGMSTPEKLWTLAKDTAQMGGLETLPSRVGNAFIGADGRPVNVNLGKAPFAHGGAVHKADGGMVKPDPYFAQGQTPFAEFRHSIGMNQGGKHFDEGGEVSQSELDRMKFELGQAQNPTSPVMQATPQSMPQKMIGTVGGYMDQAGKFVSEAIEPLAESHPRQHFIANMLVADPLKSAGTALQDYTKTSRDITEEQPYRASPFIGSGETLRLDPRVLDIAQFAAPVLGGAKKLAGVGVKAAAPYATKVDDMVRELHASGAIPQPGLSIKDVTPKALAPANEQGFYSPTEAAALNLQRKAGNGQAFLNDLLKQENVRPDEIKAMGLDTWLKDKKNVTAAEVQDYIAQNKLGLGETTYGTAPKLTPDEKTRLTYLDEENRKSPLGAIDDRLGEGTYTELMRLENIRDRSSVSSLYDRQKETERRAQQMQRQGMQTVARALFTQANHFNARAEALDLQGAGISKPTKFGQYQLSGGENYREVVLTLPIENQDALHAAQAKAGDLRRQTADLSVQYRNQKEIDPQSPRVLDAWQKLEESRNLRDQAEAEADALRTTASNKTYRSSHFDEPNILAHLRMSDRVTDGKKTLLVDEVQSDWHQAGRERGYKDPQAQEKIEQIKTLKDEMGALNTRRYELYAQAKETTDGDLPQFIKLTEESNGITNKMLELNKQINDLEHFKRTQEGAIPDAPYKEDWYQLALRRAVKEAIDGGYDRVALPTGARVNERFSLSKQIDSMIYAKEADGTYSLSASKGGSEVAKKDNLSESELSAFVGKDMAKKMIEGEGKSIGMNEREFTGLDLDVGGGGNKKYYDEIYPGYLKKFGKKYGASVGKTTVDADGVAEPLHYMDITPAMRKEFSTGIHMKKGGKVSFADSLDAMRYELTKAK